MCGFTDDLFSNQLLNLAADLGGLKRIAITIKAIT